MRLQKGFIQTPVLITIVVGVLVLGGTGYFGVVQYRKSQQESIIRKQQVQVQQKALEQAQMEIEKLKQESESAKAKQQQLEQTIKTAPKPTVSQDISSADLQPYLNTIGVISCFNADADRFYGTGVLLKSGYLMTNWHVVKEMDWCGFVNGSFLNPKYELSEDNYRSGAYVLNLSNIQRPDSRLDFAIVPFAKNSSTIAQQYYGAPADEYLNVSQLNYIVGSMQKCSTKVAVGSPVAILGYPASSIHIEEFAPPQSVTTGIISGYDASYKSNNYLVSAKVDHGNSGGLALGKENGKVCLLGIPTWVVTGQVENAGIVQNINYLLK